MSLAVLPSCIHISKKISAQTASTGRLHALKNEKCFPLKVKFVSLKASPHSKNTVAYLWAPNLAFNINFVLLERHPNNVTFITKISFF